MACRSPLTETTNRVNISGPIHQVAYPSKARNNPASKHPNYAPAYPQPRTTNASGHNQAHVSYQVPEEYELDDSRAASELKPPSDHDDTKRYSQASYASTTSSKNYKTHIGPWQLGKTLGKGSSAHVRLCRHNITKQMAAVKIVNRRMAYLVQDSSLAALSKWDKNLPQEQDGEMRVPMAIEREVAILKLIEHPHIMQLYDIWENRSEIYLVLEYMDRGDLFTYINSNGQLSEEVALYFFRQIMSAITYCHSFNICHRDLKPENILITADMQIKIADFGMAALHQTDTHHLATACGSPHYAAPELLKNRQYRGDRADIWSLGVILYAMLSATLPFDDPDIRVLMNKTKKGRFEMPPGLSLEAEDLILRMLQTNPDRRITVREIWRHPLVQKYSYLDNFGDNTGQPPDTRKGFQYAPVPRQSLDPQLLRQLRSMWHMFSEEDLGQKLTCPEPNDQKAFYWLLYNYRNKQLEDFKPELAHSMSDYHHLKPGVWKNRKSTTCEFAQPRANGHGRSISRFTVISNAAETEAGTVQSYDPYRGSRILQPTQSPKSTKVIVHRTGHTASNATPQASRMRSSSVARHSRAGSVRGSLAGKPASSRGSMSSLRSSRQGATHNRAPSLRHKRGVDFSHVRKGSNAGNRPSHASRKVQAPVEKDLKVATPAVVRRSVSPDLPVLVNGTHAKARGAPPSTPRNDASTVLNEEIRQFSNNISKDLDDAFRSSLNVENSSAVDSESRSRQHSPLSITFDTASISTPASELSPKPWDTRPLPPLPQQQALSSHPVNPPTQFDDPVKVDAKHGPTPVNQTLRVPTGDRRAVSAPVYAHASSAQPTSLPSINENAVAGTNPADKLRIVSAPPNTPPKKRAERLQGMEFLSQVENSIRVVDSPTAPAPVKIPAPLNVRKQTPERDIEATQTTAKTASLGEPAEHVRDTVSQASQDEITKKKLSWFKRISKLEMDYRSQTRQGERKTSAPTVFDEIVEPGQVESAGTAKKVFTFPFWKHDKKKTEVSQMSIDAGRDAEDNRRSTRSTRSAKSVKRKESKRLGESRSTSSRHIDVKQNWLARLFKVKPATSHLCLTMSRRRARQEVAIVLREWRKYGIRDVTIDKQRNIVYARVNAKNYLNLKEVEFAAEIMSVIEHGKKSPLSIVRFTQERGAASSLHRVVQTMNTVFESRGLLVTDKNKRKMMIKTLNAEG